MWVPSGHEHTETPNPVFSVITAVVALALLAAMATGAWRRRHKR